VPAQWCLVALDTIIVVPYLLTHYSIRSEISSILRALIKTSKQKWHHNKQRERIHYLADNQTNNRRAGELDDGMAEADVGMTTQVNPHAAVSECIIVRVVSCEAWCINGLKHAGAVLNWETKLLCQLLRRTTTHQTLFSLLCHNNNRVRTIPSKAPNVQYPLSNNIGGL